MEWKLMDGDYVPDGMGGLTALSGGEEVLARVLYRLTARRGALPFLPNLGSRLYQLGREKPAARQAARHSSEATWRTHSIRVALLSEEAVISRNTTSSAPALS